MACGRAQGAVAVLALARLDGRRRRDRALVAGILAGSIALISFGLDSFIEGFASLVIVWRFTGSRLVSHAAEERAQKTRRTSVLHPRPVRRLRGDPQAHQRRATGNELARGSARHLERGRHAVPRHRERRLADTLGSVATRSEGTQNLLCAYLAAAVLVGLLGNALVGLW